MARKKHILMDEELPSDEELEAMEDKEGTDIVDPVEFAKMQKEIDELASRIVTKLIKD